MIVALEEAKYKLVSMRPVLKELGSALRVDELRQKAEELEKETNINVIGTAFDGKDAFRKIIDLKPTGLLGKPGTLIENFTDDQAIKGHSSRIRGAVRKT